MEVYFFENVEVKEKDDVNRKNIYFTKDIFVPSHYNHRYPIREINVDSFWLGAGKVYVDLEYPLQASPLKHHFARKYLYKGASLLLSQMEIRKGLNYKDRFDQYVQELEGLSIDYMVVPKVNVKYLTVDMIRFFGLQNSPFILVYMDDYHDLKQINLGWIAHIQALVKIPIAVIDSPKGQFLLEECKKLRLLTLQNPISFFPLMKEDLILTGISPKKGEIRVYGDTDFNLFLKNGSTSTSIKKLDPIPYISVIRGNVVKLNHTVRDKKGFGQYCKISIQNHF